MLYNRCVCQKCGNNYATAITTEIELQKESCPNCSEKKLKITGPMSFSEVNSIFSGGG